MLFLYSYLIPHQDHMFLFFYLSVEEAFLIKYQDMHHPIVEIIPKKGLYDYESKYTKGFTDYFCPADIKSDLTKTIQSKALKIHKLLECRHYSRVDFILDKNLKPWFLEVNTLPGMTETSLVPKSAAVAGLSFEELIEKIIMESLIYE